VELPRAVEVFVQAFCASKSAFHPYLARRTGPLWVMEDAPGRKQGPRKTEVVAVELAPGQIVQALNHAGLGWHFVCDVFSDPAEQAARKAEFRRLGYRALATEWIFVHDLREMPDTPATEPEPRLVASAEEWARIPFPRSMRYPDGDGVRPYAIWTETEFFGRVCSRTFERTGYVSDLYVPAPHRRKGYGRALMARLLFGDREEGLDGSVLVASTAGAKLYPLLGYRQIATLALYCPLERD